MKNQNTINSVRNVCYKNVYFQSLSSITHNLYSRILFPFLELLKWSLTLNDSFFKLRNHHLKIQSFQHKIWWHRELEFDDIFSGVDIWKLSPTFLSPKSVIRLHRRWWQVDVGNIFRILMPDLQIVANTFRLQHFRHQYVLK